MKTIHIIIAFCIGLFFGHILFQTDKYVKPPSLDVSSQSIKKIGLVDSNYLLASSELKKKNELLKIQLQVSSFLLKQSRTELAMQQRKLIDMAHRVTSDTSASQTECIRDSLTQQISSLAEATDALIGRYEQKISMQGSLVAVRDSELVICDQSYRQIKSLSEELASREQKLSDDLNTALKQQKQKRLQNKFLAGGMLFITGVATSLIVKSRQ